MKRPTVKIFHYAVKPLCDAHKGHLYPNNISEKGITAALYLGIVWCRVHMWIRQVPSTFFITLNS